jgi:hypothetical protein
VTPEFEPVYRVVRQMVAEGRKLVDFDLFSVVLDDLA